MAKIDATIKLLKWKLKDKEKELEKYKASGNFVSIPYYEGILTGITMSINIIKEEFNRK